MRRYFLTGVILLSVALALLSARLMRPKQERIKSTNNLKNLGLANKDHNRDMVDPRNLAGVVADNNGKWTLQWRVPTNMNPASTNSLNAKTNR